MGKMAHIPKNRKISKADWETDDHVPKYPAGDYVKLLKTEFLPAFKADVHSFVDAPMRRAPWTAVEKILRDT